MPQWRVFANWSLSDTDYPRIELRGESVVIQAPDKRAVLAELVRRGTPRAAVVELDAHGDFKGPHGAHIEALVFNADGSSSGWAIQGIGPATL